MSAEKQKPKLVGPWRSVHGAIWLFGLAILAWMDWWWPGILVLVGLSMLFEVALARLAPQAFETTETPQPAQTSSPSAATAPPAVQPGVPAEARSPDSDQPLDLLPPACPKCGGPLRGQEVRWVGPRKAECPFCGSILVAGK